MFRKVEMMNKNKGIAVVALILLVAIGVTSYFWMTKFGNTEKLKDKVEENLAVQPHNISANDPGKEKPVLSDKLDTALKENENRLGFPHKKEFVDFEVNNAKGEKVKVSDLGSGKPKLIVFFASWCPNCRAELPILNKMYNKYKDYIEFIPVSLVGTFDESVEKVENLMKELDLQLPYYFDEYNAGMSVFDLKNIPSTVAVGADQQNLLIDITTNQEKLYSYVGAATEADMQKIIDALMLSAGYEPVATENTGK